MKSTLARYGDWLLLIPLIFIPRLLNLDVFLTPDEPLFLEHARQFAAGIATGDFRQTLGIGYPGVTTALWAAPVVTLPPTDLGAMVAGRAAIGLLTGLLTLLLYGLAKKLLGRWPALIGVVMLALDPYLLGYSRLLHNEIILTLTMTLAALSLLLWLREERWRWLLLTGVFTGLALLSKSTALLLGPMLAAAALAWVAGTGQWRQPRWWGRMLLGGVVAALIAGLVFWLLWPAMWVDPAAALSLTFGKLFRDQEAGTGNLGFFWLGQFVQDPGPAFYPVAFLLKATPWLLLGLILNLVFLFISKFKTPHSSLFTIPLWFFALTYLILMTIASKKSVRYLMPAFPTFCLLAGIGLAQLGDWLKARYSILTARPIIVRISLAAGVIGLMAFAAIYHPYYFTYYNPALLGWRWAPQTILIGWGEGLDEAARYLNNRPGQTAAIWYDSLAQPFYRGQTLPVVPPENLLTADHAVLYLSQVQRDIPNPNLIDYFRRYRQPEQTIRLNGIDYAWVYPGPVVGATPPAPATPLGGDFGGEARLLGYNASPTPVSGGQALLVTLFWQVLTPPAGERYVFLRLLDGAGRVWASSDAPPVRGLWPVARWQPGTFIEDAHRLEIPAGTPPGVYRLEAGLYDSATGQPLPASGQPMGPGGGLLLGEVAVAWQPVTQTDIAPPLQAANAQMTANVKLLGHTPPPAAAATGELLPLELVWQETCPFWSFSEPWENYLLFEWLREGQPQASQFEALPLPISQWGRGAVLRSRYEVIVPPALTTGPYDLRVTLHNSSDPVGQPVELGSMAVTAPPHQFDLPAGAIAPPPPAQLLAESGARVSLAGYTLVPAEAGLTAQLFWQTDGALPVGYKVFAQLLSAENQVVAQSDAFPAQGQRPATGWLPGEIITDAHLLSLPAALPPGRYRLIAGLYHPVTGQRLPLADAPGDALTVTEVSLP